VDNTGTNKPTTVFDTGSMSASDRRLTTSGMFLHIDWGLISKRYLMVKVTVSGTGASFGHSGAWLVQKSHVPANTYVPINYAV